MSKINERLPDVSKINERLPDVSTINERLPDVSKINERLPDDVRKLKENTLPKKNIILIGLFRF